MKQTECTKTVQKISACSVIQRVPWFQKHHRESAMSRKAFIFVAALFVLGTFAVAQEGEEKSAREKRQERREQRQQGDGNPFPNGPPPGTITVMAKSFLGSVDKGFGNTLVMISSNGPETREALGMSEEKEKEFIALRNELQGQMLQKMPKYANRFMKMTEADHKAVQEEIEREFQDLTDRVDKIATPELKNNARKTVFQFMGGLDSPFMNSDTVEALNLSKEQKEKVLASFKDVERERKANLEEMLTLFEKSAADGGPGKMTPEEREEFERKMAALGNRAFATSKKLGESIRRHLTEEQLDLEKKLIASRPKFMPPLPPQMRGEEPEEYRPGEDSWKPGQGTPKEGEVKKRRPFPLSELVE